MAKKKKSTKSKGRAPAANRSPFWAYAGAVVLILSGIFVWLGGFNTGGTLPITLFETADGVLGLAAFILPAYLLFWGISKFTNPEHRAPTKRLTCLLIAIILLSAMFDILMPTPGADSEGGVVGGGLGNLLLGVLDKIPAVVVLLAAIIPAAMYAFSIPMSVFTNFFNDLKADDPKRADVSVGDLKRRNAAKDKEAAEPEEKLSWRERRALAKEAKAAAQNDGILALQVTGIGEDQPVEAPSQKHGGMKNSAARLTPATTDNQEALTLASDPDWKLPDIDLLNQKELKPDPGDYNAKATIIRDTFANFNIDVQMGPANIGPRVTQYTLRPPSNVKLTKITALENNLALDLAAHNLRMEAPIPGQQAVGIEVPNEKPATVPVASLLKTAKWRELHDKPLGFVIGRDIANNPVVQDLAKMPHLLVAGQTGSGKSVMINTLLTSLLYHNSPSDMKLILVDPKQVEMAPYNDIPHLLTPVINEPEKCISALKWAVAEMERRLKTMAEVGKRNIGEYNNLKQEEGMPYIVIVIDELADLMMMAARDVEALIVRLAQKARAAGIHLVLATQRPSVDVITGLIKANVPARIAFTVASQVDSRTIIDQMGAEKLLGMGDMLLLTSGMSKPIRVQAAFISDDETAKVTEFIKTQRLPDYDNDIISQPVQLGKGSNVVGMDSAGGGSDAEGDMFRDAVKVVIENKKASTSLLQRRLRIGYGRAARLIEEMEEQGIIGPADGARPREVLIRSADQIFGGEGGDESFAEQPEPAPVRLIQ